MRFRRMLKLFALILVFACPRPVTAQTLYQGQDAAQAHCPSDTVVWLNTRTGVYHFQGERWYGATKQGAYVCEKEADSSGDRATENGQ
jgi:hypothetical protein